MRVENPLGAEAQEQQTHLGQWELGRVHHADCREAMRAIPDESVDIVLTDYPYGQAFVSHRRAEGKTKPVAGDGSEAEAMRLWGSALVEIQRVLKPGGACITTAAFGTQEKLRLSAMAGSMMDAADLVRSADWVWDKVVQGSGNLQFGPMFQAELILVAHKPGGERVWNGGQGRGNVIQKPRVNPSANDNTGHATQKPVALMQELLMLYAPAEGGVVLDPFAGSGTTGVAAAHTTGMRFLGFEVDEEWVAVANRRLDQRELFSGEAA